VSRKYEYHYKTVFISDVHLGSRHCKAEQLLAFLKSLRCEQLFLVGDIVDIWAMHKRVHWPQAHNNVLRKFLSMAKKGVKVTYIPGNHDANFREFCGSEFGLIHIARDVRFETEIGKTLLVMHGDELDFAVRYSRINRWIGDAAYDGLMAVNRWINLIRRRLGLPYWSLAKWVKTNVAQADAAIKAYQLAGLEYAKRHGVDGLICGHLHYPSMLEQGEVLYYNDGDWVENCTALVQDFDGKFQLLQPVFTAQQGEGNNELGAQPALVPVSST
jgi:UDP-2,3-diacylglucosamine pyrophosphatase LpxH